MDLSDVKSIYFIGIGGIGMSACAGLAKQAGFEVSGSDSSEVYDPAAAILAENDIEYHRGYTAENLDSSGADLHIVSAGEDETNPELAALIEKKISYFSFCELAAVLAEDKIRIVVTGTHGKSTTAGLLGYTLKQIDDSSFLVGASLKNLNSNFYSGDGHYFIFEGDEYRALFDDPAPKFHFYKPDMVLLTNLEYDHPDIFASLEEIKDEFFQLLEGLPPDGVLVYNADDVALTDIAYRSNVRSFSYGIHNDADVMLANAQYFADRTEIEILNNIKKKGALRERYSIALRGELNVVNALGVITLLRVIGFEPELVAAHLQGYSGVSRRFDVVGEHNDIVIVDDYAHHPTAVAQTLKAARLHYPDRRIWAVFEPHTFSRTRAMLPELSQAFSAADEILIADIYPARENVKDATISSGQVIDAVKAQHPHARLVPSKGEALSLLRAEARSGDLVVVMAVGSFYRLSYELLEALRS